MQTLTRYETIEQAIADGWRRVNRKTDRDTSGFPYVGYVFTAPNGTESTTIYLSEDTNKIGSKGCCCEMFRAD